MKLLSRAVFLIAALALPSVASAAKRTVAPSSAQPVQQNYVMGESFEFRVVGGQLAFDIGREADEIYSDTAQHFGQAAALADWHPFTTGFYVSGGLLLSLADSGISAASRAPETPFGPLNWGRSRGFSDVRSFAPYLGVGYSTQIMSSLDLSLNVGAIYGRDPAGTAGTQADYDRRRANDEADMQFYPLAGFTARYRF
jgi:hypothetical protein